MCLSTSFFSVRKSKHQKRASVTDTLVQLIQNSNQVMEESQTNADISVSQDQPDANSQQKGQFHCNLCNKSYR